MRFNRIIVIDDNEDILEDYQDILSKEDENEQFNEIAAFLDEESNHKQRKKQNNYNLSLVTQGEEGFKLIKNAAQTDNPFAVAFIDMRMPPGWNGFETAKKIREIDQKIEIVIVTAYADISREKLAEEILPKDKLLYLKKPFNSEEIQQLAANLTSKYYLNRKVNVYNESLKKLIKNLRSIKGNVYSQYMEILKEILAHILDYLESEKGILVSVKDHDINRIISIGDINSQDNELILSEVNKMKKKKENSFITDREYVIFSLADSDFEGNEVYVFAIKASDEIEENKEIMDILINTLQDTFSNIVYQKKYIDSERLASIGFAANKIIHDLKNPLNAIIGFTELIQYSTQKINEEELKKDIGESCDMIKRSTSNMREDIKSILNYSRGKIELNPEVIKSSILINFCIQDLAFILEKKRVKLFTEIKDDVELRVDKKQIKRVLENIISNAVQAFENKNIKNRNIHLKALIEGKKFIIKITDNGPGIPKKFKDKILQPFKTFGAHKGSGLGLSICKQIMDYHNGKISFESEPGETTFFVIFPYIS